MNDTPQTPFAPFQPSPPVQPEAEKPAPRLRLWRGSAGVSAASAGFALALRFWRGANKPRLPKFDLQSILSAAGSLKEADMPAFEKIIGLLQDAGKSGRKRLLAAIGKIFA